MATTAISAARFKLAFERPYIAHAVWALVPVEKKGLGTLAVDKYFRLYYDPEVEDKWTVDELTAVMYHEINHLLRDHPQRGEGKDKPFTWNVAADAEINDDIRDEGAWQLPGNCVQPESFGDTAGKMAEAYYAKLIKDSKVQEPSAGQVGPGEGNCGSAAGGGNQDYEDPAPDDSNGVAGVSEGEGDLLRKQVAQEIAEAAKSRGHVPGHLDRWAKDYVKEKVDWRKTLHTALRNCISQASGASDFTFKRMSRRNQGDVIMPATVNPIPNVAVVLDTSGSMSKDMVQACIAEIGGILKAQGVKDGVNVLSVDAKVHGVQKVFKKEQVKPLGGGGTDMRVGIKAAVELKPKPDIIVVCTDGETGWPDSPPPAKVIICIIPGYRPQPPPEWAKTIRIEDQA